MRGSFLVNDFFFSSFYPPSLEPAEHPGKEVREMALREGSYTKRFAFADNWHPTSKAECSFKIPFMMQIPFGGQTY